MSNQGAEFGAKFHKVLFWLNIALLIGVETFFVVMHEQGDGTSIYIDILVFFSFFIVLHYLLSKGVKKENQAARILSIVYGVLILFSFPIGTFFGVLLLVAMTKWWEKADSMPLEEVPVNERS